MKLEKPLLGSLPACLGGLIGAKVGYATVQAIVLAAPGQLAEQYAAVAMIRIDREQALVDLAELLKTAPQRASREAAAAGLAEFGSTEVAELILVACLAQTIRLNIGGRLLGSLPCDHAQLAELLISGQAHEVRLALAVVKAMALNRNTDSRPAQCLIDAVAQALANSALVMAPQTRQILLHWLERSMG